MALPPLPPQGSSTPLGAEAQLKTSETDAGKAWNRVIADGVLSADDRKYVFSCCGDFSASEYGEMYNIAANLYAESSNRGTNLSEGSALKQLGDQAISIAKEMNLTNNNYSFLFRLFLDALN